MSNLFTLNEIDRRKGFIAGLVGGAAGVLALQVYWRWLRPQAFDRVPGADRPLAFAERLPGVRPLFGGRPAADEAATAAVGRVAYGAITGREPASPLERRQLRTLVLWVWGLATGAGYGSTRTTTRARDIAGGFFFGLRLWLTNEVAVALLGLRGDPRRWPLRQHLIWLSGHWVYSFVTANTTRVLYRLLSG